MAPLTLNVRTMPVGSANPNMFGALPAAGALAAIASIATRAQTITDAHTNRVGGMVNSYGLGLWRAGQSVRTFVGRRTRPSGRRKLYGVPARDLDRGLRTSNRFSVAYPRKRTAVLHDRMLGL